MMPTIQEIIKDPDFLASTPETKRAILSANDGDFAQSTVNTQDEILASFGSSTPRGSFEERMTSATSAVEQAKISGYPGLALPDQEARTTRNRFLKGMAPVVGGMVGAAAGTMFPVAGPATPYIGGALGALATQEIGERIGALEPMGLAGKAVIAGTAAGGGTAVKLGWGPVKSALTRIASGTGAGAAGAAIEGKGWGGTAGEAATAAAGITAAELLFGGINVLPAYGPGGPARVARVQAKNLGEAIEQAVPPLTGLRTGQDLFSAGRENYGRLRSRLYDYMMGKTNTAQDIVTKASGGEIQRLNVPALPGGEVTVTTPNVFAGVIPKEVRTGGLTLLEAVEALHKPGYQGYGGSKAIPSGREFPGAEQRIDYVAAINQIKQQLNQLDKSGRAAQEFVEGRTVYSVGKSLLEPFTHDRPFKRVPNEPPRINLNAYRLAFEDKVFPKLFRAVEDGRMPAEDLAAIRVALYRGAPVGSIDYLPPGRGGMLDALLSLVRGEGGAPRYIRAVVGTALPGAGAQFTGGSGLPLIVKPGTQTIADALAAYEMRRAVGFQRKE